MWGGRTIRTFSRTKLSRPPLHALHGGRTWWAHFEFTRINITPTILPKEIEDVLQFGALF